jgi:DNA-binding GntR family transcriptional regulator
LSSLKKKDAVREFLLERLVSGAYRFGDKISAKSVSEETGASRFMVISALNELSADGFLKIVAQVGCEVVHPTEREVTDFFVMFGRLEGVLAEFAAARRSEASIGALKLINDRLNKLNVAAPESGEAYRNINLDFHRAIHAMAHSPNLADKQTNHWAMADFFVTQAKDFREHVHESADEHELVIKAIAAGDAAGARTLMETHIQRLGQNVVENLQNARTPSPRRP